MKGTFNCYCIYQLQAYYNEKTIFLIKKSVTYSAFFNEKDLSVFSFDNI